MTGGLLGPAPFYLLYSLPIESVPATRLVAALDQKRRLGAVAGHIFMNSPGGNISDALFLYNLLRAMQIRITVHNVGQVSSCAVTVFLAADCRVAARRSSFLLHPVTRNVHEAITAARAAGFSQAAAFEETQIGETLRERTQISEEILSLRQARDVYLSSTEALSHGIVHEVADPALPAGAALDVV